MARVSRDDELVDAADTARRLGSIHARGPDRPPGLRARVAAHRGMSRGTRCVLLDCADVFRLRARPTGCQGRADGPGPRRAVRRVHATSRCPLRSRLEQAASLGSHIARRRQSALCHVTRRSNAACTRSTCRNGSGDTSTFYPCCPGRPSMVSSEPGVLSPGAGDTILGTWADLEPLMDAHR